MSKHEAALRAAVADLGEHEVPMGSNTGAYVRSCQRESWLGGTGWPWCRAAVLKWRKQGGDKPGDLSPGAWDALNRARKRGEALAPEQWRKVVPGDEVIWNIGSGHSSLVEKVTLLPSGDVVVTSIDGNSGDAVRRCQRGLNQVRGFIAWPENPGDKADRRPLVSVVGSESGTRKLAVGKAVVSLPKKEKVT